MKLLQILLIAAILISLPLNAQSTERNKTHKEKQDYISRTSVAPSFNFNGKNTGSKVSAIDWFIYDSLANAYSFFSDDQMPFNYIPELQKLVMIHRGAIDIDRNTSYTGDDTKNNYLFSTSEDWGQTWADQILVYNSKTENVGNGRYPSCYLYDLDGSDALVFTGPVTDGNGWAGVISGIYWQGTNAFSFTENFTKDFRTYEWGTGSYMYGGVEEGNPWAMAIGTVMPPEGERDFTTNGNLAYRKTLDFSTWNNVIPPQWSTDMFIEVADVGFRPNEFVSLQSLEDGTLYAASFGNFKSGEFEDRPEPGVSISTDNGETWSEYNVFPYSLTVDYINANGALADSTSWTYGGSFVLLGENEYSFFLHLRELNDLITDEEELHHIVEVYWNGSNWSLKKVAETNRFFIAYLPGQDGQAPSNQTGFEIHARRTVDGNGVVVKWIDFVDENFEPNRTSTSTTDIFVVARKKDGQWNEKLNITTDVEMDRTTWLPSMVPNSMTDIPILKTNTIPDPNLSPEENSTNQRQLENDQYIMMGFFTPNPTGVEDNNEISYITGIYPNPATTSFEFNFDMPKAGNAHIEIFDITGAGTGFVVEKYFDYGMNSIEINTGRLSSGAYLITLTVDGIRSSELLNINK